MRIFTGSTLQLLGMKQKIHLVKNEIFNYLICNDIVVRLLSLHKPCHSSRMWAV